jgi:hypothetical protein
LNKRAWSNNQCIDRIKDYPKTTTLRAFASVAPERLMTGKCPKCDATSNIVVEALRARDEVSSGTVPVLQFLCDQCRTILAVTLDPEWQARIVAGQLRSVGQASPTSH